MNDSTSASLFHSDQTLVDDQGREHSTSSQALFHEESPLFLEEINPGNTLEGALIFDIPADAIPAELKLSAGLWGDPVNVSLAQ